MSRSNRSYRHSGRRSGRIWAGVSVIAASLAFASSAAAQPTPAPERDSAWGTVSTISVVAGSATQLLMPRVFWADSETTMGWKARWHVSLLAPAMTLTALSLASEYAIKPSVEGFRPGCDDTNQGGPGCRSYGAPSTHAMASFSALGQGTGIFLVDTLKWNDGRFHGGAFIGHVVVPLIAAIFAGAGRLAPDPAYESGGQVFAGAGLGIGAGLITGIGYAFLQRPSCGYGSGLVCW